MATNRGPSHDINRFVRIIVTLINNRDFEYQSKEAAELVEHVAPDWEGRFDNYPHAISFAEQTSIWIEYAKTYPNLYFDILDIALQVRDHHRTASVILQLGIHGMNDVSKLGVCELKWKCSEGKWLWHRHIAMKGPLVDSSAS